MRRKFLCITIIASIAMTFLAGCENQSNKKLGAEATKVVTTEAINSSEAKTETGIKLSGHTLQIYCGAGMQEPFQKIAEMFKTKTGCEVNTTFANAAQIQTQINTAKQGDYFIAGSADELAPVKAYVTTSKNLVKHIPVIAVAAGNPKGITGLNSLAEKNISTVIGDPQSTPIGKIATKAFTDMGIKDKVTLVATTTTAPQLATTISVGEADAAILWKENCNAKGVEICKTHDLDNYVKVIPAAKLSFSVDTKATDAFEQFLGTETAKDIWTSYGYEQAE